MIVSPTYGKGQQLICRKTAFFVTYLPIPLVLLTAEDGSQAVHIAPEAYQVAKAEFGDNLEFWENALPGNLKGQLRSVRLPHPQTSYSNTPIEAIWSPRSSY